METANPDGRIDEEHLTKGYNPYSVSSLNSSQCYKSYLGIERFFFLLFNFVLTNLYDCLVYGRLQRLNGPNIFVLLRVVYCLADGFQK